MESRPAEIWVYRDFPPVKQPLRYVTPIPVTFAPLSQLIRSGISLARESQLLDPHFKLSRDGWGDARWQAAAPPRISAFVTHRDWEQMVCHGHR